MDLVIKKLIIEDGRSEHIAKHDVTIEEAKEIVDGHYVFIKGREDKWLLIGYTKKKRFLTVIIGERIQKGVFGLVTVRPVSREERGFYQEFTYQIGGDKNGKNNES